MDRDSKGHGPQCPMCERFFIPNARLGERQKLCGRKACRQKYKNRWQRDKYVTDDAFRQSVMKRVRRWRGRGGGDKAAVDGAGPAPPVGAVLGEFACRLLRLETAFACLQPVGTGSGNGDGSGEIPPTVVCGRGQFCGQDEESTKSYVVLRDTIIEAGRHCYGTRS